MTTRKHNEFLDIVASDDEDNDRGYDSEAAEESKGRSVKRRKTQSHLDALGHASGEESEVSDSEGEESGGDEDDTRSSRREGKQTRKDRDEESEGEDGGEGEGEGGGLNEYGDQYLDVTAGDAEARDGETKKGSKKPLDKVKLKPAKKNKTGVVYFSSLPPYMKPFALKSLLEARGFSPITKVFLTPAVRAPSAPRRRSNKRKTYTDGWVEFASKKTAKICAETLNASIVGGRKGGWYYDDVLNLKYLKGFKWSDLMEQVQRERSEREAKRRIEDARARKEEKVFLQGYETGKVLDGIQKKNEEKRKRKMQDERRDGDGEREEAVKARRLFKQNEVKLGRDKILDDEGALEEDTKRVLGKIF